MAYDISSILSNLPSSLTSNSAYTSGLQNLFGSSSLGNILGAMTADQLQMTPAAVGAANAATTNETNRQSDITNAVNGVNSTFDGLSGTLPSQVQSAYVNANMPAVNQQWGQQRQQDAYSAARNGNDKSSAAAITQAGDLNGYNNAAQWVTNDALSAAEQMKSALNTARSSAVQSVYNTYTPAYNAAT